MDTFLNAYGLLSSKLQLQQDEKIWGGFGQYSSQLDVDEAEDIDKTWQQIGDLIGLDVQEVKDKVSPIKDMYIILDHTRTILMTITDGCLPSNIGGGSNIRNILRRVFAILTKNDWWDKIGGLEGLFDLFSKHKIDLEQVTGPFREYKSFESIIKVEHDRWLNTDEAQQKQLTKLIKKKKGNLSIDDWILAMTSWGIPADTIAKLSGTAMPNNLYLSLIHI